MVRKDSWLLYLYCLLNAMWLQCKSVTLSVGIFIHFMISVFFVCLQNVLLNLNSNTAMCETESISYIWASTRQELSSGFPTKRDSNQSPQLQRLARKLKFRS